MRKIRYREFKGFEGYIGNKLFNLGGNFFLLILKYMDFYDVS